MRDEWSVLLGESFRSRSSSLYRMWGHYSASEGEEMPQVLAAEGAGRCGGQEERSEGEGRVHSMRKDSGIQSSPL